MLPYIDTHQTLVQLVDPVMTPWCATAVTGYQASLPDHGTAEPIVPYCSSTERTTSATH